MKLILASGSARRRDIMELMGYDFEVVVSNTDEDIALCSAGKYVEALAQAKAEAVFAGHGDACVVGCDTVVCLNDEIIGKPRDAADAFRILSSLSGQAHTVYTGLCVLTTHSRQVVHDRTDVVFRSLCSEEIESYIKTGEPFDKAGAYGIQGPGCFLVDRIDGNYFNVIGLPAPKLYEALAKEGILPRFMRA